MDEYQSQLTTEGFMNLFDDLLKDERWEGNYLRAYSEAEEIHYKKFGKMRFKNYESFRNCRRNYIFKR